MEQPKWQLDDSTIGTNPGIALRPMPPEARFGNTLIWYNSQQPENMTYWYDAINEFLRGIFCLFFLLFICESSIIYGKWKTIRLH